MSDQDESEERNYGQFQNEIYAKGLMENIMPTVTTDWRLLEEQAKKYLGARSFNYVSGGAGEKATMDANRLAFRQWKFVPRMLRDNTPRDMSITLFGRKYPSPILVAPIGVQSIFHEDKETGVAEISQDLGIPYILSTASSSSMEEVAEANGDGERWFQLYWPTYPDNNDVTESLLKRAKDNGYKVLVVTLDTWQLAWRPADLDNSYVPFIKGVGNVMGFSDPVFRRKFKEAYDQEIEEDIFAASQMWAATCFSGKAHYWSEIKHLQEHWDGPIVLKGIQSVEDAKLAAEAGVQGIIVSNHGGRQCDGAVGSLDQLPEIADAVGDKLTILFDSGVRTGVDILKALCLGAKGVLVGRPWAYGLGIAGKRGAKQVLQGLLADADQTMGLSGIKTIAGCNRKMLKHVNYGGDVKAML